MIHIAVAAQRVFTVPADLAGTTSHFREFGHSLDYLAPHLRLVATYARDQYRMLYSVTEAGASTVSPSAAISRFSLTRAARSSTRRRWPVFRRLRPRSR